jgi:hypothetical protein
MSDINAMIIGIISIYYKWLILFIVENKV